MTFPFPSFSAATRWSLRQMAADAGLLAALALCVDAGDKLSYPGSGQTWFDVDGNYDFSLGATTGVSTDDPTFIGFAGRKSAAECFQYDGGDYFNAINANDTFLNSLHKLGSDYTVVGFVTHVTGVANVLFATLTTNASSALGVMSYVVGGTNQMYIITGNGSALLTQNSAVTLVNGQVNMVASARQIISGTNRNAMTYVNGTHQLVNATASWTPSASAGGLARIGANLNATNISGNTAKTHGVAVFNRLLSQAELNALRTSCQRRWPTI
jgi:hypothetical protein